MLSNWVANREMKKLLKDIYDHPSVENLEFNFLELYDLFFPKFKKVKDCVIIAEESVDELEMYFDKVMKTYKYKTWYEVDNTETRIDCHFEGEISMMAGTQIALIALEIWALRLKQIDPDSKFCLIMFFDTFKAKDSSNSPAAKSQSWIRKDWKHYKDHKTVFL